MDRQSRGYFGIGVENLKTKSNLGTLWRSAYNFGASFIFVIGNRYKRQCSDTVKAYRSIPLYEYINSEHFLNSRPLDCMLIGVEINERSRNITGYCHFERAIYLLGPEDGSLSPRLVDKCHSIVEIPSKQCLNVATAGSIIMYDRIAKENTKHGQSK